MKRDMDLARQILFEVEKFDLNVALGQEVALPEFAHDEIVYHIILLDEAGLIIAKPPQVLSGTWRPIRLTWEGHEFLDAIRDD